MKTLILFITMLIGFSVAAQTKPLNGQISESKTLTSNIGVTLKADSLKKLKF